MEGVTSVAVHDSGSCLPVSAVTPGTASMAFTALLAAAMLEAGTSGSGNTC